jgi:sterol desaturase/sphingolipid hydroxylase (fatty acid hydroxylase superfamily)
LFPGHRLFGYLFAPAFLLLSLLPWWHSAGQGPLTASALAARTSLTIVAAMFFTWLAEQLYPRERRWNVRLLSDGLDGWERLGRDLLYLVGGTQLTALLLGAVDPYVHAAVQRVALGLGGALPLWPSHAPFALRVGLAFFGVELLSYGIHRAAHRSRLLWQVHSTHHVITELNAFKAVRTHPLDNLVFHVGRLAPLMLLGAGAAELSAAVYFGALLGILAHANLALREGPLGLVVNFPRWHAVHHAAEVAQSNSNFGCHTVLFDRLFGTFREPGEVPAPLGVAPVGPRTLWQELVWPLYRWVSPDATEVVVEREGAP